MIFLGECREIEACSREVDVAAVADSASGEDFADEVVIIFLDDFHQHAAVVHHEGGAV